MRTLTKEETYKLSGGAAISAALVNAAVSALKTLYLWGQNIGSSIGRAMRKINC